MKLFFKKKTLYLCKWNWCWFNCNLHLLIIVYSIIVHEGMVFLENCYLGFFVLFKKTKKESWIHFPITISNGDFEGNETLCQSGLSNDLNWAINSLITSFFRVELDVFDCFLSALSLTASDSEEDPEPSELDSLEDCVPKIGFKKNNREIKMFFLFLCTARHKILKKVQAQ